MGLDSNPSASFFGHFETLEDPRLDRCKRHLLGDILFLAVVPFVWRYSRVVWLHLDWLIDPVPAR